MKTIDPKSEKKTSKTYFKDDVVIKNDLHQKPIDSILLKGF